MTASAVRPWRNALRRERSLPSGVVSPVLLSALRRLASICLRDVIENRLEWVRFVIVGAQCRSAWPGALPSPLPICPPLVVINFRSWSLQRLHLVGCLPPQILGVFAPKAAWQ